MIEPVDVPTVYCQKEKRQVPIWWCVGSYTQKREPCSALLEAEVNLPKNYAKVKCKLLKEED